MSNFDEWYRDTREITAEAGWKAGAASRQVEVDAALKQRDSFIKAHHISMDDVCKMKDERDALQKRIDEALQFAQDAHSDLNIGMLKMVQILKGESK